MRSYPSPCDTCAAKGGKDCLGTKCNLWLPYYRTHQKWINLFAKRLVEKSAEENPNVWRYGHPDEVRDWINTDPCEKCMCRSWCNGNCKLRQKWRDMNGRIE